MYSKKVSVFSPTYLKSHLIKKWSMWNLVVCSHPWASCNTICQCTHSHPPRTDSLCIHPCVLILDTDHGPQYLRLNDLPHMHPHQHMHIGPHCQENCTHIVIITMWTILVTLLVVGHVLAKHLFALFAGKCHLCHLLKLVVLCFCMTFCIVKPLLAAWGAYWHLCIQDMFAAKCPGKHCIKDIKLEVHYRPYHKHSPWKLDKTAACKECLPFNYKN